LKALKTVLLHNLSGISRYRCWQTYATISHTKQSSAINTSTFDDKDQKRVSPPPQDDVQWVQSVYFQWNSGRRFSVTFSRGTVYSRWTPGFWDWNSSWTSYSHQQHLLDSTAPIIRNCDNYNAKPFFVFTRRHAWYKH